MPRFRSTSCHSRARSSPRRRPASMAVAQTGRSGSGAAARRPGGVGRRRWDSLAGGLLREVEAVGWVDGDDPSGSRESEGEAEREHGALDRAWVRAGGVELVDEVLQLQVVQVIEAGSAEAVGDSEAVGLLGRAAGGWLEWPASSGA